MPRNSGEYFKVNYISYCNLMKMKDNFFYRTCNIRLPLFEYFKNFDSEPMPINLNILQQIIDSYDTMSINLEQSLTTTC